MRYLVFSLVLILQMTGLHAKGSGSNGCKESISKLGDGNFYDQRAEVTKALAERIKKEKRIPTQDELADFLGITAEDLASLETKKRFPKSVEGLVAMAWKLHPRERTLLRKDLAKAIKDFFRENAHVPDHETIVEMADLSSNSDFELLYGDVNPWNLIHEFHSKDLEVVRNKVAREYVKAAKEFGRTLTPEQLAAALEIELSELEAMIGPGRLFPEGFSEIKTLAKTISPSSFNHILDTEVFDGARTEAFINALRTHKRILATAAVSGAPVDPNALATLKVIAKARDAAIVVIPVNMVTNELDPILLNDPDIHILTQSVEPSPHLILDNLRIMGKMKNPLEGTQQLGPRGQSRIFGSPKFASEVLGTADGEYFPHRNMTTGAITAPNYSGRKWISKRTDRIYGHAEHVMGAVLIERTRGQEDFLAGGSPGSYRMRHVEYVPETHSMIDLNERFNADGSVEQIRPRAAVLGDIHVGVTNQSLLQTLGPKLQELNPREIVLHDIFDGRSVNHHEAGRSITLAQKAASGQLRLEDELREVAAFFNGLHALLPDVQISVIRSNHDMFLDRWLEEGRYLDDPVNYKIGVELAKAKADGKNPLEYYLLEKALRYHDTRDEDVRQPLVDRPELVHFLKTGQSYKLGDIRGRLVEVGFHGHRGVNGKRGAIRDMKIAADRIIFAHTHTEKRDRHAVNIGTSTAIKQDYTKDGFSSWVHSWALVNDDGSIQVIDYFDSQTFQSNDDGWLSDEQFFDEGYPLVHPYEDDYPAPDGGQVDQWSGPDR